MKRELTIPVPWGHIAAVQWGEGGTKWLGIIISIETLTLKRLGVGILGLPESEIIIFQKISPLTYPET